MSCETPQGPLSPGLGPLRAIPPSEGTFGAGAHSTRLVPSIMLGSSHHSSRPQFPPLQRAEQVEG